ncbi:nitronate monooxygenase [archaeon]|nr:nitronate monooxygenase [archaeon]
MDLPKFKIGNLEINLIQGGMGVGISGKNLSSAVANCGGAGIIASVALGSLKNYPGKYILANQNALRDEIRAAKKMSKRVIGVNIMRALTDYKELVKVSSEENVDLIISGAGLALDLPGLVQNKSINLVPIVSTAKIAKGITNIWNTRYNKIPDAFIVEGPKAGGHLGFNHEQLVNNTAPRLENIAKEVIEFANTIDKPVIVAGGIYTGKDIAHYLELGAAGVQMATRFVTTFECDADDEFKRTYLNANKEDVQIIKSPVGMPGRAIKNNFLKRVMENEEKINFKCTFNCLKPCKPKESLYCIADVLINAQKGHFENGFAFAGSNAYKATPETCLDENGNFITVETLMQRLSDEYHSPK